MTATETLSSSNGVLIVDGDILSRHAIADYLRNCGYVVVEAASTDEAVAALQEPTFEIDVILCDIEAIGSRSGFELATWVRHNFPRLEVRLAGNITTAAATAADLCENGPHLARTYEPETVVDYIKRLRAARDRIR